MAKSDQLRALHQKMQLNQKSKHEDEQIVDVVERVIIELKQEFGVKIVWRKRLYLVDIIRDLRSKYPSVPFADPEVSSSFMSMTSL